MQTAEQVVEHLHSSNGSLTNDDVQATLDRFCEAGLMLGENGQYLSLAIPSNPNW
jgi:hypothetical protein